MIKALKCAAITEGHVEWTETAATEPATIVEGICMPGFYVAAGKPYRACDITGSFTEIQNPCQRTCAAVAV